MDKKNEIKEDIIKFSSLDAINNTSGGKILILSLKKDIISSIDELSSKYKTSTHIELIALLARLSERLTMLRVLNRAKDLKKMAQEELDFLLKEESES
jgi:hypothetical protein